MEAEEAAVEEDAAIASRKTEMKTLVMVDTMDAICKGGDDLGFQKLREIVGRIGVQR